MINIPTTNKTTPIPIGTKFMLGKFTTKVIPPAIDKSPPMSFVQLKFIGILPPSAWGGVYHGEYYGNKCLIRLYYLSKLLAGVNICDLFGGLSGLEVR